ncbi:angiopoietin-2-like [Anneissia japonica]|uniref:angiopoietin-2-like n=1 Tax=Anneissia japonica TaxID=1529436 RepID=UPI00142579A5|nr:angiopoietin-2-like [Anneissia japonica]
MFRHLKLFLIFLLLTFSASGVESVIHALSMSRANGHLLSSHSLHHSSVRGLTDCVELCLRHFEECSSIAYDRDRQMCDVFASKSQYQLVTLMFPTNVLLYTMRYRDCTDVKQGMSGQSGVYKIMPCPSCDAFLAYCDMDTDGKAWTVFQRRQDGSVDFNQNWQNYASGFGKLSGEFWLGNKKIHKSAKYEFRIDMVATDDSAYHVTYESIEIGSEAENFRLNIGEYIDDRSTAANSTDVKQGMRSESGVYKIMPCSSCDAFLAYCDMDTDDKAWTVFQRRQDGSVDFNKNWQNYASGFGKLSGEFWLGNKKIHKITSSAKYEFRIDMVATDDSAYHVTYESIEIGSEAENFRLDIGEYIDDRSTIAEGLDYRTYYNTNNNGMSFSTVDRDNDNADWSCSFQYKSGWWFNACYISNLNGLYKSGIVWDHFGSRYYLRFSEMKMRRVV